MRIDIINEIDGTMSLLVYYPNFIKNIEKYEKMLENTHFYSGYVNSREISRQQIWFSDPDTSKISENWKLQHDRWQANKYPQWLLKLQTKIEKRLNNELSDIFKSKYINPIRFNNVLINKYRDGNDFIPHHRDNENIFGENPTIVSLSFGDTRDFVLNRVVYNRLFPKKMPNDKKNSYLNRKFTLKSGDLLIMAGSVQKYFSHSLLKSNTKLTRYNLTFRYK
jgi:alkylated DNA repair dioxygenase AlkB